VLGGERPAHPGLDPEHVEEPGRHALRAHILGFGPGFAQREQAARYGGGIGWLIR
jgi:hypothetical protein